MLANDMHWRISTTILLIALVLLPGISHAQTTSTETILVAQDEFLRGTVIGREDQFRDDTAGTITNIQVRTQNNETIDLTVGGAFADPKTGVQIDDAVVIIRQQAGDDITYYLADRYRLPWLYGLIGVLILAAIIVGRKRGVTATLGLAASAGILGGIMLPQIANGIDPLLVALCGGTAIAIITTVITHGVRKESALIIGAILMALLLGTGAASLATFLLELNGIGSEEAVAITYGPLAEIHLRGLLIAGVILGCLGVLDDVVATQVAAVKELASTAKTLTRTQLYRRGMRIGREHVAALINTLFLAYAGASLPLLLVGNVNLQLPLWAFLNTESVAEEILRTVIGSLALIAAVPIATMLAAWYFGAKRGAPLHPDTESA